MFASPFPPFSQKDFDELMRQCRAIFRSWDDALDGLRSDLRSLSTRRKALGGATPMPVCLL